MTKKDKKAGPKPEPVAQPEPEPEMVRMVEVPVKEAVEKVVEEVKAEKIPVKAVSSTDKKMVLHESGQMGYYDDDNNFVPAQ